MMTAPSCSAESCGTDPACRSRRQRHTGRGNGGWDREAGHVAPHFLPDGRHSCITCRARRQQGIYASSLVDGRPRKPSDAETAAVTPPATCCSSGTRGAGATTFDVDWLTLSRHCVPGCQRGARVDPRSRSSTRCRPHRTAPWRFASATPGHIRGSRGSTGPADISAKSGRSTRAYRRPLRPISVSSWCCAPGGGNNDVWSMDTRRGLMTRLTTNPRGGRVSDVVRAW